MHGRGRPVNEARSGASETMSKKYPCQIAIDPALARLRN